jgi:hypothetical protein
LNAGNQSFFLAETLKYIYLLCAPPGTLDSDGVTLNTENPSPAKDVANQCEDEMRGPGYTLSSFGDLSARVGAVRRQEVSPGDSIIVRTQNSVYALRLGEDGAFSVSGGWFRRKGRENIRMTITGCSLGGNMIRIDTLVACGFSIEFGNRLVTSPVRSFFVLRNGGVN